VGACDSRLAIAVAWAAFLNQSSAMTGPFARYVRWTNALVSGLNPIGAPKLVGLFDTLLFMCFWGFIVYGFRLFKPAAAITQWFEDSWFFLVLGSVIMFSMYRFCRNFLDARTGG
jgi:hypothetical protein